MEKAIFAGGCFWCTEAIFQRLKGVNKVMPGYANSNIAHPSYAQVSSGSTGAAEAIEVTYDPSKISYLELLEVFFKTHDPTELNKQGADVGPQYRSAVFYVNSDQKTAALKYIKSLSDSGEYSKPIATGVNRLTHFYKAEEFHRNYYNNNQSAGYCRVVIDPKINKLLKGFKEKIKAEYQ
ncbi:peptide-methionine (S)-S-oxide reductase [Candidatus Microgenomates bacterium]|nr:MAG: peptide-methionine (S)-S-oxide reductase [Candidatus Microgenomates bacterium]